jgi:hypothetical protein
MLRDPLGSAPPIPLRGEREIPLAPFNVTLVAKLESTMYVTGAGKFDIRIVKKEPENKDEKKEGKEPLLVDIKASGVLGRGGSLGQFNSVGEITKTGDTHTDNSFSYGVAWDVNFGSQSQQNRSSLSLKTNYEWSQSALEDAKNKNQLTAQITFKTPEKQQPGAFPIWMSGTASVEARSDGFVTTGNMTIDQRDNSWSLELHGYMTADDIATANAGLVMRPHLLRLQGGLQIKWRSVTIDGNIETGIIGDRTTSFGAKIGYTF